VCLSVNTIVLYFNNNDKVLLFSDTFFPVRRKVFSATSAAANHVRWEWNAGNNLYSDWTQYPADVNEYIEEHFQQNKNRNLDLSSKFKELDYTLDFSLRYQVLML